MLLYNLRLAVASIRRHPVLTALIVSGIALGVCVSTATLTIYHLMAQDPLPGRSGRLYYVRLDSWDPAAPHPAPSGIPPQLTYQDMRAVMRSGIPAHQAAMYMASLYVFPDQAAQRPFAASVRMTSGDFFPMFATPFRYGAAWTHAADERPEPVVVISSQLNQRLFGGGDSTGKTLRLGDRRYRIAGVLAPWRSKVRFYDLTANAFAPFDDVFMPLNWVEPLRLNTSGNSDGWKSFTPPTFEGFLHSESTWLEMWVELPDAASRRAYQEFLDAYVREQKRHGRFARPMDNRLTPMTALMDELKVVPQEVKSMSAMSLLFLAVCSLNLVGLFLGKFLARAPVVGVRRALGASRGAVFLQHIVECELVGLVGGAIGLLLSAGLLAVLRRIAGTLPAVTVFFHLDATMVLAAIGLSLAAGLLAGIYPSWRICAAAPALHLKTQ